MLLLPVCSITAAITIPFKVNPDLRISQGGLGDSYVIQLILEMT